VQSLPNQAVSVIIPCYNGAPYLREAIDSALRQTAPPLEILVVDDGSTDGSAEIAASYGPPVRLLSGKNRGVCLARNWGIEEAKGDWVAFLDADDVWEPEKLRRQLEVSAADPEIVATHTNFYYFGREHEWNAQAAPLPGEDRYSVVNMVLKCPINWSTPLVRRSLDVRFPDNVKGVADQLYGIDLLRRGRVVFVDECLAGYRRHATNMTADRRMGMVWHDVVEEWLGRDPAGLTPAAADKIRSTSLGGLVDAARGAKWRRDWGLYWELRDYLAKFAGNPSVAAFLATRPLPAWVYAVKDRVATIAHRRHRPVGTTGVRG
jgi:glycosyltransferase involved in cell wall biosynthesis